MDLKVEWLNATRTEKDRILCEQMYKDRLLSLCGDVHKAKSLCDAWAVVREPTHKWQRYNAIAFLEATAHIPPSERNNIRFKLTFNKGTEN